mmetsp:Transcript_68634/g.107326  ORF Transcript_68634/g.107326 Transcript_68634/m.107326 type:complete len:148 (+) Transcript_68634:87-530(+)
MGNQFCCGKRDGDDGGESVVGDDSCSQICRPTPAPTPPVPFREIKTQGTTLPVVAQDPQPLLLPSATLANSADPLSNTEHSVSAWYGSPAPSTQDDPLAESLSDWFRDGKPQPDASTPNTAYHLISRGGTSEVSTMRLGTSEVSTIA